MCNNTAIMFQFQDRAWKRGATIWVKDYVTDDQDAHYQAWPFAVKYDSVVIGMYAIVSPSDITIVMRNPDVMAIFRDGSVNYVMTAD